MPSVYHSRRACQVRNRRDCMYMGCSHCCTTKNDPAGVDCESMPAGPSSSSQAARTDEGSHC